MELQGDLRMGRVFITGAGRGLGLAFVKQCLQRGDLVFAGVRRPEKAEQIQPLLAEYPEQLELVALDVTDADALEASWQQIREKTEVLDLLINNAGINSMSADSGGSAAHLRLGQLQGDRILSMFHVNAIAPLIIAQRFIDLLEGSSSPRIVSISSWLGSLTNKSSGGNYSYCASKTALNMLMRCLAFDVLPKGIVSIVVNPGWVQTDMGGSRAKLTPEQSVTGILNVVENLTQADAGRFLNWDGSEHAW